MKIAVFGDSFAGTIIDVNAAWPDMIGGRYTLQNFAEGGTSLYWSIEKLIEKHEDFDTILFFVTSPGRIQIAKQIIPPNDPVEFSYISGFTDACFKLNRINTFPRAGIELEFWKNAYQAGVDYYKFFHSEKKEIFLHQLLVDKIKDIRPDTIIINSFTAEKIGINEIYKMENLAWDITPEEINKIYYDKRSCHMTAKNNEIFSKEIESYLLGSRESDFEIRLEKFAAPTSEEKSLYLFPISEYYLKPHGRFKNK
jgi:hypothetical protein